MMKKQNGFTLLELLIAIMISTTIVFSMMQSFRSVQRMIKASRLSLRVNKSVTLLFNQIERDFTTAIIPVLAKEEKIDKDGKDTKKAEEEKKKEEETKKDEAKSNDKENEKGKDKDKDKDKKEKGPLFFISTIDEEANTTRIEGKKYKPFKQVSFVNTNPLQVWGQLRTRLVRVQYELVPQKKKKWLDETIYDLIRRETLDVKNEKFKVDPQRERTRRRTSQKKVPEDISEIRTHLVAKNIISMYVEFTMPKPEKKEEKKSAIIDKEEQILRSFEWGKEKATKNVVPQQAEIIITFFANGKKGHKKTFHCTIPILSYPTTKRRKKKKKQDGKIRQRSKIKKAPQKAAQPQPGATPPAPRNVSTLPQGASSPIPGIPNKLLSKLRKIRR